MTADLEEASAPDTALLAEPATGAVVTTASTNAVLAVVSVITGVLAARLLGPDGRGILAAAMAIGTLVGAIGALALGESLVYFVGRRVRPPLVVLNTASLAATASATVVIGAAILGMPLLLSGQPEAVTAARAYCLVGLTFVLLGFPTTYLRALQRYRLWNVMRLIAPLCWLVVLGTFTLIDLRDVVRLVIAFVALQAVFIPMVWVVAARMKRGRGRIDLTLMRPMIHYGAPLLLATLPQALNLRLDQVLIANIESAGQLGLYAVSVSWAGLGLPVMAAIGSVLFPKLAAMERTAAMTTMGKSTRVGVLVAVGIGLVSAVSAPVLVPLLFGHAFSVPLVLPLLLAAATSILGLNTMIEEGLRGLGEPRTVLAGESTGLMLTVLLLVLLVPTHGILGAATASLAGYSTVSAVLLWRIRASMGLRVREMLVPRWSDFQAIWAGFRGLWTR
jgi:O-antigen/teichoic acid export membrane protein